MWSLARSVQWNDIMASPYITCKLEEAGSHATGIAQQQLSLQDAEGKPIHPQPNTGVGKGKTMLPQYNLPPFPSEWSNGEEDSFQYPDPGVSTSFFSFAKRCDLFFPVPIQNSIQVSAVLSLSTSPSILALVPDSCRICTTKCLSAGAEQW